MVFGLSQSLNLFIMFCLRRLTHYFLYTLLYAGFFSILLDFQRWKRLSHSQFWACVLALAKCKCAWLYELAYSINCPTLFTTLYIILSNSLKCASPHLIFS